MNDPLPLPGWPQVLSFAASDPSSGAGIQADLLTLASLGCHPLTVITALTAQDTVGVTSVRPVAAELLEQQARVLLNDMPVAAFKVGLLGSADNARAVANILADYPEIPLVLDPVLASGRGDILADEALIEAIGAALLPRTTLLTPNTAEARRLAKQDGDTGELPLAICAQRLIGMGASHVLLTGADDDTPEVVNTLYGPAGVIRADRWQRLPGSYHGSGCTLAAAIAAGLASGAAIEKAVGDAQQYTWQTLAHGFRGGKGQWIPNRFFALARPA
ncbi:MAG: hydroxymethylpyrimidine/phosphomethylpyrimidine kinase [Azonexus sp.]|jgi:hydroxymethylpyrimidine/phosphomethylpyrimidine kinase|nr:hydroxymethylpyrimidine/phosphomethylpyrimidine kinase [Azonexus sp.]